MNRNNSGSKLLFISEEQLKVDGLASIAKKLKFETAYCKPQTGISGGILSESFFLAIINFNVKVDITIINDWIAALNSNEIPVVLFSEVTIYSTSQTKEGIRGDFDLLLHPPNNNLLMGKVEKYNKLFRHKQKIDATLKELEDKKNKITEDQQKLKILTTAVSEPIIFVNQDLIVTFWNQEAQNVFGYSWYEAVSESFLRWLVASKSQAKIKELFEKANETGHKQLKPTQNFTMRNKLGVETEVNSTVSFHKINKQEFNLVFVIHDSLKKRRLEKEILRSRELREENKIMRENINYVGFDLRVPLNAILGVSKTLVNFGSDNLTERQQEGLSIISQSGKLMLELVNDLQEITKINSKKLQVSIDKFDYDKMLAMHKSQAYQFIKDKPIKIVIKKSPSIPNELLGDSRKINQILYNLFANAVKCTEKGKIVLSTHLLENKLFIEIADSGKGISKNIINQLFDNSNRVEESDISATGAGLGLYISKKLVELMNGEITAESEKGKGTVFRFYVTLPEEVRPIKPAILIPELYPECTSFGYTTASKLILVIDDSPENSFIYRVLSENGDYSVIVISNGKKAPLAIKDFSPDLLVLKMEMPGIHGTSIIRELRNKHIKIPIIAFSQFDKPPLLVSYNVQFISEPLNTDMLISTIETQVKWIKKKKLKVLIVYEDKSWIKARVKNEDEYKFVNNISSELSFIQICQNRPDHIIVENVEKTSNSLPLLLRIISENGQKCFEEMTLQYEGIPMKYLLQKIEVFNTIKLQSREEILKLDIFD